MAKNINYQLPLPKYELSGIRIRSLKPDPERIAELRMRACFDDFRQETMPVNRIKRKYSLKLNRRIRIVSRNTGEEWVSIIQCAKDLGVCLDTLYRKMNEGKEVNGRLLKRTDGVNCNHN